MYKNIIFLCFVTFVSGEVIVETSLGKVAGKQVASIIENEKYYSFLSIPYARPPVDELRFMPPKPHPGWEDVLDAKKERKHCPQLNLPIRDIKSPGLCGDENCLHLNIHTPKLPKENQPNLPVIVFLYNEQFRLSYNASREYSPDFFMKEDVIFITISHRLGAHGFLSFEDDLLPGNNGLRDVITALKWIKDNISNFGGNPNSITLMGSQGGAAIADILLHSPKSKGLFHRVILQSGTSWNPMYFTHNPRDKAIELGKIFEIKNIVKSSELVERLRKVSPAEITETEHHALHADESRAYQRSSYAFGPVIEHDHPDAVLTKFPDDGDLDVNIPVMIGYNSREAIEIIERYLQKPQYLTFADRDFLTMLPVKSKFHFDINSHIYNNAVTEIKNYYFEEGYVKVGRPGEYLNYCNDIFAIYPIDYTVRQYTNYSSAPVYYYTFDYSGEFNIRKQASLDKAMNIDGTWGASVGDELCYMLVCNKIRKSYKKALADEESEEIKVLRNIVRLWSNFAKYGNPTFNEQFEWTPATSSNKECLVIGDDLEIKTKLHEDMIQFWDNFLQKYQEMAVDGVVKDDLKDEL